MQVLVELLGLGYRVGDDHGRAQTQRLCVRHDGRDVGGGFHPPVDGELRPGQVEAREGVRPPAEQRHAESFQPFEGRADVQDRLHPGADHSYRRAGKRDKVSGFVGAVGPAAVYATEPTGGEHADAGAGGEQGRGRDRGCAGAA